MKLNVAQLTRKIAKHRPLVVCFVGKKIWDIYEGVVSKTALAQELQPEVLKVEAARRGVKVELPDTPPPGINAPPLGARSDSELSSPLSEEGQQGSVVGTHLNEQVIETDLPEDIKPTVNITQSPSTPLKRAKSEMISLPASSERKAKSPGATKGVMDWTAPRPFRLPWPEGGGHTYFWVTPNTSGLERTPVSPISVQTGQRMNAS
jgi:TDG/mug DNA glycosylase family protein